MFRCAVAVPAFHQKENATKLSRRVAERPESLCDSQSNVHVRSLVALSTGRG